jgi:translation initiation factor IF-2
MRVYEVARDLNISSEALLEMIRGLGVQVKSHMSAVDDSTVETLHGQFQREKEKIKEADVRKRERQQKQQKPTRKGERAAPRRVIDPSGRILPPPGVSTTATKSRATRKSAPAKTARAEEPAAAATGEAPPAAAARAGDAAPGTEAAPRPAAAGPATPQAESAPAAATPADTGAAPDTGAPADAAPAAEAPAAAEDTTATTPAQDTPTVAATSGAGERPAARPAASAAEGGAAAPKAAAPKAAARAGKTPAPGAPKPKVPVPVNRPRPQRPAARPAPPPREPHVFRPSQSAIVTGRKPPVAPRRPSPPPGRGPAPPYGARRRPGPARGPMDAPSGPPPSSAPGAPRRRKDKKKKTYDEKRVRENVRRTMQAIDGRKRPKRRRKSRDAAVAVAEEDRTLRVTEFITLGELADLMGEGPTELIAQCLNLGVMATINQRLDKDTIATLADEMGYEVEFITEYGADQIEEHDEGDEHPEPRPPVVTVMGHVDHGKTTLLDYIRRTNVAGGEAGQITQHIGAYSVEHQDRKITFLDTPGHAAFTAMRARGAQATDIVVIVVAADDKVMPQTVEAINHAKAASVPMVVAINKIDLPGADPQGVKNALLQHGVVVEELGGNVVAVPISAKKGTNIEQLLEMVLLVADVQEYKADPHRPARGVVLEAKVDQGRGMVASVLVQRGTLKVGETFICGVHSGKVRAMFNEWGDTVEEAGPSTPVEVLGWNGLPQAGDTFAVLGDEREAHEIAHKRQVLAREQQLQRSRPMTLADLRSRMEEGAGAVELNLIVKGDVDGSVQALIDSLGQIPSDEVKLHFVHRGVGNINESDVLLAAASEAVILGFHVRTEARASHIAHEKGIDIHVHRVIYEAVDTIKKAMEGMLKAEEREIVLGAAEVRQVFKLPKLVVAGCYVTEGKIPRSARIRLFRGGETLHTGKIASLKRFKDDVREVASGFECGIALEGFQDVQIEDIIEAYRIEQVARTLG